MPAKRVVQIKRRVVRTSKGREELGSSCHAIERVQRQLQYATTAFTADLQLLPREAAKIHSRSSHLSS
jgi:uncharacterized protein YerC